MDGLFGYCKISFPFASMLKHLEQSAIPEERTEFIPEFILVDIMSCKTQPICVGKALAHPDLSGCSVLDNCHSADWIRQTLSRFFSYLKGMATYGQNTLYMKNIKLGSHYRENVKDFRSAGLNTKVRLKSHKKYSHFAPK